MVSSRFFWFCARRLEEEDAGQYPLRIVGSVVRGTATRGHALGVSDPYFIRRSSRRAAPGAGPARALLFCRAAGRRSCRWHCPREWCERPARAAAAAAGAAARVGGAAVARVACALVLMVLALARRNDRVRDGLDGLRAVAGRALMLCVATGLSQTSTTHEVA